MPADWPHVQPLFAEWVGRSLVLSLLAMAGLRLLAGSSAAARSRFLVASMIALTVSPLALLCCRQVVAVPWVVPGDAWGADGSGRLVFAALLVWIIGCCARFGAVLVGLFRLQRELARAGRLEHEARWNDLLGECCSAVGLRRRPGLVQAQSRAMPCVVGMLRPTVVMPAGANRWSDERCRMVMLHELGHLKRGDLWLQWLSLAVRGIHWFNPLVGRLREALLLQREEACDALVVAAGARPGVYARHLLEIAIEHRSGPSLAPAWAMAGNAASPGHLERRIARLLSGSHSGGGKRRWMASTAVVVIGIVALGVTCSGPSLTAARSSGTTPWTSGEAHLRWSAEPFPSE